ncbi:CesT family type III secretion system chaperone [Vibrio sp. S4M6]|uniref:CesT family type III secretion system chaperone n=1 Tax=Vibrio sinus TaxID=2946865 RepID=UPI00202A5F59|nr:CesT family type III secretion system chaperone [Vibrio sinus]MCL9783714.1 CesT family type III secretion system chaperone [Vibrio sinus]
MKSIQCLLDEFCAINALPQLPIEVNGRCQLLVDDHILVYFIAPNTNELWLSARVGGLPRKGVIRTRGLEVIARANYYGLGCGGGSLSVSPDGRQVILFGQKALAVLDGASLTQWFDEFHEQSMQWQARFATLEQGISCHVEAGYRPDEPLPFEKRYWG